MNATSPSADRYDSALKRGAFYNFVGLLAKLIQPLFIVIVTWLWGPSVIGAYLLALSAMDIVSGAVISGYADATIIFASRHAEAEADAERKRALYAVLANALACTIGLSIAAALITQLAARSAVELFLPHYAELLPGLYYLIWALVPRSITQIAVSATRARLRMEYDALLNGMAQPLLLLAACLGARALGGGLTALCVSHLVAEAVLCIAGIAAFGKFYDLAAVRAALRGFRVDRAMLGFAIPQSLNMTLNRYIARLNGFMLAAFGLQAVDLAYFGTAAMLTSNLNQIRLVFSTALAPVAARHHGEGNRVAFESSMNRVARWSTAIAVPATLACVVLRDDIMQLVSKAYTGASGFIVWLLVPPFISCAYGIAGSALIYAGHSRVTLVNSALVALLNTGISYALVPRYGMAGAAAATALATALIGILQVVELWKIEHVRIRLREVWKPHAGLLLGAAALALLWDPAQLSLWGRAATVAGLVAGYTALLYLLRQEDLVPRPR